MKCFYCRGTMKADTTSDLTDLGTCVIVVRGVPCHKCTQCGEISFNFSVGERVEQIVDSLKDSLMEVAITNYSDIVA